MVSNTERLNEHNNKEASAQLETSTKTATNEVVPIMAEPEPILHGETPCPSDADLYGSAVMTFESGTAATMAGTMSSSVVADMTPSPADADLKTFLARPVRIGEYEWTGSSAFGFHIDPWALLLSNTRVQDKIKNYKYLRANMCVEILINGNPFQYGQLMVSYQYRNGVPNGVDGDIRQHSMLPHVIIEPTDSKSHSLCLPFTSPGNYIDLTDPLGAQIGVLNIDEIVPLLVLDSGQASADISIFAWLTDPVLAGPTSEPLATITPQAGVISGPTSFVASIASRLTDIPIIGKYAKATETMGNAISSVAALFGFSRHFVTSTPAEMVRRPGLVMAATDTPVVGDKLSLGTKQELSIDPTILGSDQSGDELALSNLVHRFTYGNSFSWAASDDVDDTIISLPVTPYMLSSIGQVSSHLYTNYSTFEPTSLAYAAHLFDSWRGGITIKVKPVCSRFHRGRIRVGWDPQNSVSLTPSDFNTQYSTIVDLSEQRDYEFTIPFLRDRGFLTNPIRPSGITGGFDEDETSNGVFFINVVNQLTSQGAVVPPVSLVMWIKGAPDMQFARPRNIFPCTTITPQSGIMGDTEEETTVRVSWGDSVAVANLTDVHNGEIVTSLRPLLKRFTLVKSLTPNQTETTLNATKTTITGGLYPPSVAFMNADTSTLGYYPPTEFKGTSDPDRECNIANGSLYSYLDPLFLGRRGGFRWALNIEDLHISVTSNQTAITTRSSERTGNDMHRKSITSYFDNDFNYDTENGAYAQSVLLATPHAAFAGSSIGLPESGQVPTIEIPDYNNLRYHLRDLYSTGKKYEVLGQPNQWSTTFSTIGFTQPGREPYEISVYAAAADDFTFMGFVGIPKMNIIHTFVESQMNDFIDKTTTNATMIIDDDNYPTLFF
jgi:hypothetical protein